MHTFGRGVCVPHEPNSSVSRAQPIPALSVRSQRARALNHPWKTPLASHGPRNRHQRAASAALSMAACACMVSSSVVSVRALLEHIPCLLSLADRQPLERSTWASARPCLRLAEPRADRSRLFNRSRATRSNLALGPWPSSRGRHSCHWWLAASGTSLQSQTRPRWSKSTTAGRDTRASCAEHVERGEFAALGSRGVRCARDQVSSLRGSRCTRNRGHCPKGRGSARPSSTTDRPLGRLPTPPSRRRRALSLDS